jgi:UDP-N-acetylglucosamine transferase subunit ALG13
VAANTIRAAAILHRHRPDRVISTGSNIALSFLPLAVRMGASAVYVESATRATAPSLTGRLLTRVPGVQLLAQHHGLGPRWRVGGSVFDGYRPVETAAARPIRRVVVLLGATGNDFRALVERLLVTLPGDADVLWQTGLTDVSGLGIDARPWVAPTELAAALKAADLVISHCGVGSVLDALDAGKCPVVVARRSDHGGIVDDHQQQLASMLAARGLAVPATAATVDLPCFVDAAARTIRRDDTLPLLVLDDREGAAPAA